MTVPRIWPPKPTPMLRLADRDAAERAATELVYPESDGQPVGETELHFDWMVWLVEVTRPHLVTQGTHVGANMFFYHVEGDPRQCFCPDYYAIRDCDPDRRFRIIKLWEEPFTPCFVLETTSNATKREDQNFKRDLYRRLGIGEYFLFDPTGDWLEPALQGYRLSRGRYVRVRPERAAVGGGLLSRELGLHFVLDDGELRIFAGVGGPELLTGREQAAREAERARAAEAAQQAEAERADAEAAAREASEAAREAAEAAQETEAERADAEAAARVAAEHALEAERRRNAELRAELARLTADTANPAPTPKRRRR